MKKKKKIIEIERIAFSQEELKNLMQIKPIKKQKLEDKKNEKNKN